MPRDNVVFIQEASLTLEGAKRLIAEKDATIEAQRITIAELRKDVATLKRQVNALLKKAGVSHLTEEGQLSLFGDTGAHS